MTADYDYELTLPDRTGIVRPLTWIGKDHREVVLYRTLSLELTKTHVSCGLCAYMTHTRPTQILLVCCSGEADVTQHYRHASSRTPRAVGSKYHQQR
jgi:hypothetical protein